MADDDQFEPRLGRMRSQGGKRARRYLGRVLAAANLARAGLPRGAASRSFSGSRLGRGAGVGRVLGHRGTGGAAGRRVIVKASIVKLAGKGASAAAAHLRYLRRDGTTREGAAGQLYGRDETHVDAGEFQARGAGDRHQFRLIVSPEDGAAYEDLKLLTRRLMAQVEEDLGTTLDWVAVDHHNTGHPHTHIVVRGKDERGADLVIAREYLTEGIRARASELVAFDLGPRSPREIDAGLRQEVEQERLTSLDRALLRAQATDRTVSPGDASGAAQALHTGRLAKLERLGLAERLPAGRWRLAAGLRETLLAMGERGDIVRLMQRQFSAAKIERAAADQAIYAPAAGGAQPLVGRVLVRGLADEHRDRHYLLVDATDGRSHYVPLGRGETIEPLAVGAVVRIVPRHAEPTPIDRTIVAVAAASGGRYDVDAHLAHDPAATQDYAETNVRRLEAQRRAGLNVTRAPSGSWAIAPDHLERVAAHETARLGRQPVTVELLADLPLDRLARADGATWLDRELLAAAPTPLRDAGFGREVSDAQRVRRQWLIEQGLAQEWDGATSYRANLLAVLQRRELQRAAAALSNELGLAFVESAPGARIEGTLGRRIDLVSGRFATVERARDFTLVPWRPVLEQQLGKPVAGLMRESGISWTIGRGRSGPTIS